MRENRTYGSEGGEGHPLPDPYQRFSRGNCSPLDGRAEPDSRASSAGMTAFLAQ